MILPIQISSRINLNFFSLISLGKIFLKMVFGDIFDFGPKYYLNLVWGGTNRAVAYNHPFCNDVEKKGLKAALSMYHCILYFQGSLADAFMFF